MTAKSTSIAERRWQKSQATMEGEVLENAIATQFVDSHPNLRWTERHRCWREWDGVHWCEDEVLGVYDGVRNYMRDICDGLEKASARTAAARANTIAAVERLARADQRIAARPEQWNRDPWLLGTPDGTVDLRTGTLRPADPDDYITKLTRVGPGGECPRWMQFLGEVTDTDTTLMDYLQRLAGYCLTASTAEQAFVFCYGTGANGKGVFLNTLTEILADYAVVSPVDTFTETHGQQHPTDLAMLDGARLVVAQETEEGRRWAVGRIKTLTGGDPITARKMRQDFYTFRPVFKLVIAGNHKPTLRHVDEAIRRRIHLVPFVVTIPPRDRDHGLSEKLRAEWPGILAWAIEGCLRYQAEGLNPPDVVMAATRDYLNSQDEVGQWIEDCCETAAEYQDTPTALFNSWRTWAHASELSPGTQKVFRERLESLGYRPGRNRHGRFYTGIRVALALDPSGPAVTP